MNFIKWGDNYRVGVDEIDNQHKKLIDLLNSFVRQIGKLDQEAIDGLLKELIDYTHYHFKMEENILIRHAEFDFHKSEHQIFIDKVNALQQEMARGNDISEQMLGFLLSWLKNHILKTDQKFFAEI